MRQPKKHPMSKALKERKGGIWIWVKCRLCGDDWELPEKRKSEVYVCLACKYLGAPTEDDPDGYEAYLEWKRTGRFTIHQYQ